MRSWRSNAGLEGCGTGCRVAKLPSCRGSNGRRQAARIQTITKVYKALLHIFQNSINNCSKVKRIPIGYPPRSPRAPPTSGSPPARYPRVTPQESLLTSQDRSTDTNNDCFTSFKNLRFGVLRTQTRVTPGSNRGSNPRSNPGSNPF